MVGGMGGGRQDGWEAGNTPCDWDAVSGGGGGGRDATGIVDRAFLDKKSGGKEWRPPHLGEKSLGRGGGGDSRSKSASGPPMNWGLGCVWGAWAGRKKWNVFGCSEKKAKKI